MPFTKGTRHKCNISHICLAIIVGTQIIQRPCVSEKGEEDHLQGEITMTLNWKWVRGKYFFKKDQLYKK